MLKNNIVQCSAPYYNPLILELSCIVEKKKKKNIKWLYLYIYIVNQFVNVVVVVVYFETKVHASAIAVPTPKWTHLIVVIIRPTWSS